MNALDLRPVLPAVIVAVTALVVLLAQAFTPKGKRGPCLGFSLLGLGAALVATLLIASSPERGRGGNLGGALVADDLALFLEVLILGVGVLAVLLSPVVPARHRQRARRVLRAPALLARRDAGPRLRHAS